MSSPAHSTSSDEDSSHLAELKAKYKAKIQEAAEKKERKERERCEHKEWERKEREAREAQELAEMTCRLWEAYSAAAERAQEWIEKKARAETERIRAALTHMQESVEQDKAGSADEAERLSGSDTEEEGRGLTTLRRLGSGSWHLTRTRPRLSLSAQRQRNMSQRGPPWMMR